MPVVLSAARSSTSIEAPCGSKPGADCSGVLVVEPHDCKRITNSINLALLIEAKKIEAKKIEANFIFA
jgi:hypothetical protein